MAEATEVAKTVVKSAKKAKNIAKKADKQLKKKEKKIAKKREKKEMKNIRKAYTKALKSSNAEKSLSYLVILLTAAPLIAEVVMNLMDKRESKEA